MKRAVCIRGTFVHTLHLGDLEILRDYLLVTDSAGVITHFHPAQSPESQTVLQKSSECVTLPSGTLIVPNFVDLHLHAAQFLYQGNGLDLPLMVWLNEYAYKAEERLDADPALARKVYARLAQRLIHNGTGTVLLFGTIKEETKCVARSLFQPVLLDNGICGKLSMDMSSRPSYQESSSETSLQAAHSFVEKCRGLTASLPSHERLVEPVLTPRFVPTCSDQLLVGLGQMSATENLKIQSHLAEALDQVEWVRSERGAEDMDVFDRSGLLTTRTVQAHCTFLNVPSLKHIHSRGTAVAHCPLSNSYFSAEPFRLREALDEGVKVGLGTDIAGGYSLDLMSSMRHAVSVSRMREGSKQMIAESLYLATKGGATALGLTTGVFSVGTSFDAQEIRLFDSSSRMGVGALDFFDLEISGVSGDAETLTIEMVEKWWCLGDARNRVGMWVQGAKLQ
ncbi:hypothetical protein K438DRAFT_1852056 [Mycena galopus ATCC 62051]|nr:hypothetical protein K438DRAFT_1852056 [Mycena galopus ATCC 62051]